MKFNREIIEKIHEIAVDNGISPFSLEILVGYNPAALNDRGRLQEIIEGLKESEAKYANIEDSNNPDGPVTDRLNYDQQAQKNRIMGEVWQPTRKEIESMSMEQYVRWRASGVGELKEPARPSGVPEGGRYEAGNGNISVYDKDDNLISVNGVPAEDLKAEDLPAFTEQPEEETMEEYAARGDVQARYSK